MFDMRVRYSYQYPVIELFILAIIASARDKIAMVSFTVSASLEFHSSSKNCFIYICIYKYAIAYVHVCGLLRKYQTRNRI